jgi:hypothetical protein
LKAIELKPSNFAFLSRWQMTTSVMCRAFELDVENIKYLTVLKITHTDESFYASVKGALEHAVMVHGYEKVANGFNNAPDSPFKKVLDDIKKVTHSPTN